MKVGIDIREVKPGRMTGIGRYTLNFVRYVAECPGEHEYVLYSDEDMSAHIRGERITHRRLPAGSRLAVDLFHLGRAARADGVDVFYSPYVKAPLNTGAPAVNTVHDLMYFRLKEYQQLRSKPYHWLFARRGKRVCRRAALVVTVSEHSKRDLIELWRVREDKIVVVPNVVGENFGRDVDDAARRRAREKYDVPGPYVFYMGNFLPHKNLARLIAAFARLPEALRREYWLALAGGSEAHRAELAARADTCGVADRVRFLGFVDDEDAPALYAGASLFVFPSLYEGFGLPPLEAMACAAPVAVAEAASLPEVVGDAGLRFDPYDIDAIAAAMERVLADAELAKELSRKAVERAELFRPRRIMPRLLSALERAAGGAAS